jgi:hypothetical protein
VLVSDERANSEKGYDVLARVQFSARFVVFDMF